jgi:COP9 signalosome complex subunit 3
MDLVTHIIENSRKESDLETLRKTLETNLDKLRANAQYVNQAINALDAEKHTLGVVYLLFIKSTYPNVDQNYLLMVENLFQKMNPKQARKCADRFGSVVHRYTEVCRDHNMTYRAMKYLLAGLEKFRISSEYLTPLHADYLCLCLKAKNYKAGYNLIESSKIFDINPDVTGLQPRDMLLYYYYGGMIYIGLKQFEKALRSFDTALSVPAYGLNAIMVESFKKYVLVSLLVNGKFLGISKHASNVVHRHMKTYCSAYTDFANAYGDSDTDKVHKLANDNAEAYMKDNNLGLVKQCIAALYRRNIRKLTETYMTLSLADIAKSIKVSSVKEAETQLLKMIENGEINAVINQKDGMVSFEEEGQSFKSSTTGALLDDRINKAVTLANRLKNMDDDIASSSTYIARLYGVREDMLDFGERSRGLGAMGMMMQGKLGRVLDFFNEVSISRT